MINKIHKIDALQGLKQLNSNSIDCIMTSPPYWALRDYGTAEWVGGDKDCNHIEYVAPSNFKKTKTDDKWKGFRSDKYLNQPQFKPTKNICKCGAKRKDLQLGLEPTFNEYISKLCDIFDEAKRVLKDTGTCWVNIGDTYSATRWTNNENSGQPMNKFKDGWRGINPIKDTGNIPDKCLVMIPFRFAIEMVNRGWILRNTIIWHKPNCMPSSAKDRFTVDFEYVFFFVKQKKYFFETQYDGFLSNDKTYPSINTKQNIYAVSNNRNRAGGDMDLGRNKRTVWQICPQPFPEAHFAVYPEELCETPLKSGCPEFVCVKCGKAREKIIDYEREQTRPALESKYSDDVYVNSNRPMGLAKRIMAKPIEKGYTQCQCNAEFKGGIVLDMFSGAGTTALVSLKQNKRFIGFEINQQYIDISNKRLKPYLEQTKLTEMII